MAAILVLLLAFVQTPAPAPPLQVGSGIASPAAAFAGQRIERVDVLVDGRPTADPILLGLIETRPATPLAMASVRETIAHLSSLGRFQDVSVEAEPAAAGVVLSYRLTAVHAVERIEFTGNLGLGEGTLRNAVRDRFGATPPASRASAVAETLQAYYFDRGYLGAAIRPIVEARRDPPGTILTFEIEAGARAMVRNVTISGDPGEPRDVFLGKISATPGEPYERLEVQSRLTEYVEKLRRAGRYEARGDVRVAEIGDDGRSVDLAVSVDQGPEIVIRYEGDQLPKGKIDELVPVRAEGSIDPDIIEDAEGRIIAYLRQEGYWKASVTTARQEADGRIEIVFKIQRGAQYRIDGGPVLTGHVSVPLEQLMIEDVRTALKRLDDGEVFNAVNLDAASVAIRGFYLRRGYAQVKVDSAANEAPSPVPGQGRIKPVITIVEGPLMTVGEVTFSGNVALSSDALAPHVATKTGETFYEPKVIQDRENVVIQYQNHGFAGASVDVRTAIVEGSRVNLTFQVAEGAQSIVDHVLIVGNVKTETVVIEREVQFRPGQPLGLEALFETRRRLAALGLFRRVRITEIPHGETNTRDVLIEVEEAPATTVGYGGGVELSQRLKTGENGEATEETEIAPRGFFEIGRRNLGGRNRSVNLYTRLSLRSDIAETGGGTFGFPEYRVVGTYREPRAFLWNADVTVTAAIEQGARSTFNFARKGVNAEVQRRFPSASGPIIQFTPGTAQYVWIGRYSFSTTRTFDERLSEEEQATIDRIFPQVRLSVLSTSIVRDTRDDAVEPTRGFFLSGEGSVAMRALGGEVGYVKTYMQAHAYRRLFQTRRLIFAGRFGLGLADGFPRQVEIVDAEGNVRVGTIEDLPASERFFAGGDTTIRGFALDSVGAENTITPTGFPRGGNGLVLMNAELRVPIWGDVSGAVFVDGGNVFERVTQIDFANLRGAVGVGVRYKSPIGPLRLDVGFKLDRRVIGGELESPRAWHFSFGHAF